VFLILSRDKIENTLIAPLREVHILRKDLPLSKTENIITLTLKDKSFSDYISAKSLPDFRFKRKDTSTERQVGKSQGLYKSRVKARQVS
jgi:hypothetical protein